MNETELKIEVDGKNIPTNEFVRKFLCNTLSGALESLHGVNKDWKDIKINIKRTDD